MDIENKPKTTLLIKLDTSLKKEAQYLANDIGVMNIVFAENFTDVFRKLDPVIRIGMIQQICYFSTDPLASLFNTHPIYVPTASGMGSYVITLRVNHRAVYHLVDDTTALFTKLLSSYEHPVVLPHDVQT